MKLGPISSLHADKNLLKQLLFSVFSKLVKIIEIIQFRVFQVTGGIPMGLNSRFGVPTPLLSSAPHWVIGDVDMTVSSDAKMCLYVIEPSLLKMICFCFMLSKMIISQYWVQHITHSHNYLEMLSSCSSQFNLYQQTRL